MLDLVAKEGAVDAVARVDGLQGVRSMPMSISVTRAMPREEAMQLRDLLANGGQQALLNAVRGEGTPYPRAALAVGTGGRVKVDPYLGVSGTLPNVTRTVGSRGIPQVGDELGLETDSRAVGGVMSSAAKRNGGPV